MATAASFAELRTEVRAIAATMPHLATAASVSAIPHLATAASVSAIPHLATAASVSAMEARIIKWMLATALASNGLLFIIAKCLH